jgi:23S rRNA pseudouridine2604 synthase
MTHITMGVMYWKSKGGMFFQLPQILFFENRPFGTVVRLAKRMSELDLCSRREADRLILQQQQDGNKKQPLILVRGKPIPPLLGQKISSSETDIVIVYPDCGREQNGSSVISSSSSHNSETTNFLWDRIQFDTVVLHKPLGYVSGQPNAGHKPAVRLLTLNNYYDDGHHKRNNLHLPDLFPKVSSTPNSRFVKSKRTLQGYVPAGRLDINSTGLLIFTKNGVMAKKLVSESSNVEKEYLVTVKVPDSNTRSRKSPRPLPSLYPFIRGGHILQDDYKPLLPLTHAEWIEHGKQNSTRHEDTSIASDIATLKLVLKEGRKRQVRKMCSEILGMDVISLQRVRIGPKLRLEELPLGKWRFLSKDEVMDILQDN